jgi:cytochrome c551
MRLLQFAIAVSVAAATLAPVTGSAGVTEGRRAWLKYNCYGCHGNNGAGGMGPNVQQTEGQDVATAMFGDKVEGGMRDFTGIASSTDAYNIGVYLLSIGTPSEPKWLDWWNPIP